MITSSSFHGVSSREHKSRSDTPPRAKATPSPFVPVHPNAFSIDWTR